MTQQTIAIVGAGFSGTLLALHLMRQCSPDTRIVLIERNEHFGRGAAYSTGNSSHLLNVPAAKMSAFQARPSDFLDWLKTRSSEELGGLQPLATTFVPRAIFGRYISDLLETEMKSTLHCGQLELLRASVRDIAPRGGGLVLTLGDGEALQVDRAVLAVGNFPPSPPPVADSSFYDTDSYRSDPWAPDLLANLDPQAPLLLIGTGLTTVDTVVSLLDQEHRGPIIALSRRGLLPQNHLLGPVKTALPETEEFPTRLTSLARFLRDRSRRAREAGGSWQAVIDELRPLTTEIWQAMPREDRLRFLRHLRPWWDTHRHRISGPVAARIAEAQRTGQLRIQAGRIRTYAVTPTGDVDVTYRPRFKDHLETLSVGRVINCSGPESDFGRIRDPLVRRLLDQGMVRPDSLSLGLDITRTCALLGRDGGISRRLFAVGPVTKGAFWEMTAVPDIRQQAEYLAGQLAALVKPAAVAAQASDATWSI
ncbi:FAD/NAD(P)-binding protein [Acidisoma cellulosilytica]|uniref:FAD/NAD(P)-binding protein n=1 Tax=Acidisoma cellulosilyticum TaxID=2802395 RepID=A0A963Z1U3_9PROT|nr:FAD/NAD(P)-binding protein [Acidisoma cellulosilyticum]MCB8880961.1 FAD/NAD(P)-binding protein [Acidisoma cellulosilyticum]